MKQRIRFGLTLAVLSLCFTALEALVGIENAAASPSVPKCGTSNSIVIDGVRMGNWDPVTRKCAGVGEDICDTVSV